MPFVWFDPENHSLEAAVADRALRRYGFDICLVDGALKKVDATASTLYAAWHNVGMGRSLRDC